MHLAAGVGQLLGKDAWAQGQQGNEEGIDFQHDSSCRSLSGWDGAECIKRAFLP
jgi:hypothetical protein